MASANEATGPERDRRGQRRQQTLTEILDRALGVMELEGVAGLSMAALAREMSMRPPSLYKYYPSLMAIYDALFRQGQQENLEALRRGMSNAEPGLAAVTAGIEATGRWAIANPVLAQLLFWRPVPGYVPTSDALSPASIIVGLLRSELVTAAAGGQIHSDAATDDGLALLSAMHFGVISQHLANEPDRDWEHGRFTRLHPRVVELFVMAYPPEAGV
jgi:AcrR family transcriptional regulator